MTTPDVYLVAAAAAVADLKSTMLPEFIASRSWFIAAIDAVEALHQPQPVKPIDVRTPVVLKQAIPS